VTLPKNTSVMSDILDVTTDMRQYVFECGIVHRDQRMVADEFYPALRFQLLGDGARIVLGTGTRLIHFLGNQNMLGFQERDFYNKSEAQVMAALGP